MRTRISIGGYVRPAGRPSHKFDIGKILTKMEQNSTKNIKLYHLKDNLETSTLADRQNASDVWTPSDLLIGLLSARWCCSTEIDRKNRLQVFPHVCTCACAPTNVHTCVYVLCVQEFFFFFFLSSRLSVLFFFLSSRLSFLFSFFLFFLFLVACTRLYKPLCRPVGRSVGPSVPLYFFSQSGL